MKIGLFTDAYFPIISGVSVSVSILKQELTKGFIGKIGALLSKGNLNRFKYRLAPEEIGGAMIYGLKGVVVKAQGSSKSNGFYNGIRQAALIVRNDVLGKVQSILESDVK